MPKVCFCALLAFVIWPCPVQEVLSVGAGVPREEVLDTSILHRDLSLTNRGPADGFAAVSVYNPCACACNLLL